MVSHPSTGGTGIRELTRGLATLPPKRWIQEPSVVRDRDGRHPRGVTLWQCTASVCVAGVHCWEISFGLADPWNVIFCLSC